MVERMTENHSEEVQFLPRTFYSFSMTLFWKKVYLVTPIWERGVVK